MLLQVRFHKHSIQFKEYPIVSPTLCVCQELSADGVAACEAGFIPPALALKSGELLFLPAAKKKQLLQFCAENAIPVRDRPDNWSFLLEPFLDTEFSSENQEACFRTLEQNGFSREECGEIRSRVQGMMLAYNFDSCLWEWCHLGLFDLLCAASGVLMAERYRMERQSFSEFSDWAFRIALREKAVCPATVKALSSPLRT